MIAERSFITIPPKWSSRNLNFLRTQARPQTINLPTYEPLGDIEEIREFLNGISSQGSHELIWWDQKIGRPLHRHILGFVHPCSLSVVTEHIISNAGKMVPDLFCQYAS